MNRTVALAFGVLSAWSAHCAPFADPTRPPGALENLAGAAAPGAPRLESVLIAPDRRVAVISGQQVTVGSRFGDGRVVRITESEVVIRTPGGDESLKLLAASGKRAPSEGEKRK
jgi:MSHA biogenesis protein MshK